MRRFCGDQSEYVTISNTLRRLINLQSLKLRTSGNYLRMLSGCTFQLHTFFCGYARDTDLICFLNSQPKLKTLHLGFSCGSHQLAKGALPNLTKIEAPVWWLWELIPGRAIQEVSYLETFYMPSDVAFLASSMASIHSLSIGLPSLQAVPGFQIAAMVPELKGLTIIVPELSITNDDRVRFSCLARVPHR